VRNPLRTSGATPAALFRAIEAERPTILLDEIDVVFSGHSALSEPIRGLLDSGNREGGNHLRAVPDGDGWTAAKFSTFGPKCLAGIDKGDFPETITDRAIILRISRKKSEQKVAPFRYRDAEEQAAPLRKEAERWAEPNIEALAAARPEGPPSLSDRAMDAAEPLLAIADQLGGDWPEMARYAVEQLHQAEQSQENTPQLMLLAAIRKLIAHEEDRRWPSKDLLDKLNNEVDGEDAPWLEDKGLTAHSLAKLLRPFKIEPMSIRIGQQTLKGYKTEAFQDAWERYLPGEDEEVSV
jgi:hypothetical protein